MQKWSSNFKEKMASIRTIQMEQSVRRRRLNPLHDAEQHVELKIDKPGLIEQFINSYKGRGVIATKVFKQGDFVLEYRGKLCKEDSILQKNKYSDTEEVFLFDFQWQGNGWCVDASVEDKSLGRLVNDDHQRPNCKMKTVEVEGLPHLCLFALRDIDPGEEITYNYGKANWPWRKKVKSTGEVHEQNTDHQDDTEVKSTGEVHEQNTDHQDDTEVKSTGEVHEQNTDHQDDTEVKSTGEVHEQNTDHQDDTEVKSTGEVHEQNTDHQDDTEVKSTGEVHEQNTDHQDDTEVKSTGEVHEQNNDHQEDTEVKSTGEVHEQNNDHQDDTEVKSTGEVHEQNNDHQDDTEVKSTGEVHEQNADHQDDTESLTRKLQQHCSNSLYSHKKAEMEQNTKERKTTMMLVKRAKLAQELAELDALLNSQLDSPHNVGSRLSSQPLLSSDNSVLKKSMTNDTSDCGQLALKRLKTVSSAFATTSSVSHESGNQLVESSHKKSLRKKQATIYMETCSDWSDCTDYSDADYAPDSEESSAQDEDACLYPTAKKPLRSLRYPLLSPVKQDDGSESSIGEKMAKSPKKRTSSTPTKRKFSIDSPNSNVSTPKKSRFEQISHSIKVLPPSKSGGCRVYNKRNYCLYCLQPTSKLARHLETVHKNVEDVALAFQYPKNSKERRNKLNILRRRGNFAHNASVVKKGAGELQACYRPKKLKDAFDFIHCYHCQGLYAKKTLWKHMRRCPAKNNSDDESSTGKHRVRSKCALKTAVPHDIGEGLKSVISCMKYDKVTQLIQNDKQLLQFGQHLYDLNGSRKNRHDYIRQRLRELGRLLLTAQKSTPIQKAEELIYPANFNHLISAVKELAGYNPTNNTFRKPTLALKIGNSLGIICELVETDNLSSVDGDSSLVRFAREFKTIKNFRWKGLITRGATTTMTESKWNSPQILPLTEDVKRLDSHMENVKAIAEKMLRSSPTASNYAMLAKVTLAQVIIFNRRREGEVSRMELSTFKERKKSEINEDMAACLTPLEKKMCDFFTRVEIRGKRGRGVPVLLKPSMVSAMELLVESRESCCIPKDNVYMFARPGALSAYRGGECIQKFARECHAKNPDVLTSTRLRKHIATMSQVLNLQENEADQLANFLGHDIRVHRQYYRLPQGTLQLAKMSKVLLALEKGTLSLYKGQALDDIEIDPEERVDLQELDSSSDENDTSLSREAMEVTKAQENEAIENDDDVEPETSSSVTIRSPLKHGNRGNPKQKWEDSEVRAVERHMMRFIHTCKVPQKMDCIRCINAEPYALKNRNWTGVKNYVRNRITALKRKACAKD
ncbi:uncharacterized protein [Nothobranchius furzeri]